MFSLVKIISDGENNFTQNKYNKLQKISAKNKCFFCKKIGSKVLNYGVIYSSIRGVKLGYKINPLFH